MGFRDTKVFNLPLLAKQRWRIVQNPTSILARALKGKYHLSFYFLDATLGPLVSYAWHSIWEAWGLLVRGLQWRIENGQYVRVWGYQWLPVPSTFEATSTNPSYSKCGDVDGRFSIKEIHTLF